MEQVFFRVPFASNGDTSNIPESVTSDGSVNWLQGWPLDYEKDMDADANAKAVEREVMNFLFNAITVALHQHQTGAFPEFITAADNGGGAYAYAAGTVVRYRVNDQSAFKNYVSLVNANTAVPGSDATKWQEFIFAEASDAETTSGKSGVLVVTPRRLKKVTDEIYGKIEDIGNSLGQVNNLQAASVVMTGTGITSFTVPVDCKAVIILGYAWKERINSNDGWSARIAFNGSEVANRSYYGQVGGSSGHAHRRLTELNFASMVNVQYQEGQVVEVAFSTTGNANPCGLNVVLQFIQSDIQQGENEPTNLIVSPNGTTISDEDSKQFTSTVLPSELSSKFPVTWSVADALLGSVDSQGLYNAVKGRAGVQTVIASISTGKSDTATLTQHIYLDNGTQIGTIPELTAGDLWPVSVSFSPANYSEPVTWSSSDSSVADISADGTTITSTAQGTATIAVTGNYSGISASVQVRVVAKEVIPEFLRIDNNLAEIEEAGKDAQSESRKHLGLGNLATKDALSAKDIDAVPLTSENLPAGYDLNDLTVPGEYFQSVSSNASSELHYPEDKACSIKVYRTGVSDGACRQEVRPYDSGVVYSRSGYGDPLEFSEWEVGGGVSLTADEIWEEVLGIDPDNVQFLQEGYINPAVYNTGFGVGSTMLAARVSVRGSGVYSSLYPGTCLRPAAILAPYLSAGDSPAVLQIQTNSNASNIPGTWRKLGYTELSALNNSDAPIEGESYPVTLWIRIY